MMKELLTLCRQLLDISQQQKNALDRGEVDYAVTLLQERQRILENIQKIDIASFRSKDIDSDRNSSMEEKIADEIKTLVGMILNVDRKSKESIQNNMWSIKRKLQTVKKMKDGFCQGGINSARASKLNINV